MTFFDCHCHLSDLRCEPYLEPWLSEAQNRNLRGFFLGGISPSEWRRQQQFQAQHPQFEVFTSAGFHPWWVLEQGEGADWDAYFQDLARMLPSFTACGELGLDTAKDRGQLPLQIRIFEGQLELARRFDKPLVLHIVRKHSEALDLLKKQGANLGMVHSFSGDWKQAKRYLDLGFLISISGGFLSSNRPDFIKVIQNVPPESLLIETDSPDQPIPEYRQKDSPGLQPPIALFKIAEKIGEIRRQSAQDLLAQSRENLVRVFKWKSSLSHAPKPN